MNLKSIWILLFSACLCMSSSITSTVSNETEDMGFDSTATQSLGTTDASLSVTTTFFDETASSLATASTEKQTTKQSVEITCFFNWGQPGAICIILYACAGAFLLLMFTAVIVLTVKYSRAAKRLRSFNVQPANNVELNEVTENQNKKIHDYDCVPVAGGVDEACSTSAAESNDMSQEFYNSTDNEMESVDQMKSKTSVLQSFMSPPRDQILDEKNQNETEQEPTFSENPPLSLPATVSYTEDGSPALYNEETTKEETFQLSEHQNTALDDMLNAFMQIADVDSAPDDMPPPPIDF